MSISLGASLLLVYAASLCYVAAAYYHLALNDRWSFGAALALALPIVLVEYCFALPGIHALSRIHGFQPSRILVITVSFYFVNLWALNALVLGKPVKNPLAEAAAMGLVLAALCLTHII